MLRLIVLMMLCVIYPTNYATAEEHLRAVEIDETMTIVVNVC